MNGMRTVKRIFPINRLNENYENYLIFMEHNIFLKSNDVKEIKSCKNIQTIRQ